MRVGRTLVVLFAVLALGVSAAQAHGTRQARPIRGIAINALTHGQMAVVATYRSAILELAARRLHTDETMRRLMNFASIEYSACLWGLVPGSLRDEDSPFNECSHAYLSASAALLEYLRTMPGDTQAAERLSAAMESDMLARNAVQVICRFSGEKFYTGDIVMPAWSEIPTHFPSLAALAFVAVVVVGGIGGVWRATGASAKSEA